MPVHQFVHDSHLLERGLRNYWGYNTIGFFAPHAEYSSVPDPGGQVREFKGMVKTLHEAGIEVILDVVYNHTAEGNQLGPTLSFKGIDNPAYYRLVDDDPQYYMDYTGTGNIAERRPAALAAADHGLAALLGARDARRRLPVRPRVGAGPRVLRRRPAGRLLRARPAGPGHQPGEADRGAVGRRAPAATRWATSRRSGASGTASIATPSATSGGEEPNLGEFAARIAGSADLYEHSGRRPFASINFVTAHDGFTLRDLVSYNEKHNEANGEDGRDGESFNRSWNHGAEGPTNDTDIIAERARAQRNLLATLLLSQGVPMILHGDEVGRTQEGDNNTYAQDSEISWMHWDQVDTPLLEFTATVAKLRADHPTFRRKQLLHRHRSTVGDEQRLNDIVWLHPDGHNMDDGDWTAHDARVIGHVPQRPGHRRQGRHRQPDRRPARAALLQRRPRPGRDHPAAGGVLRAVGGGHRHRRGGGGAEPAARQVPGAPSRA